MKETIFDLFAAFLFGLVLGALLCGAAIKFSKLCERPAVEHMIGE